MRLTRGQVETPRSELDHRLDLLAIEAVVPAQHIVESWAACVGLSDVVVRSNVARAESHPFYERLGYARTKTQHVYLKTVSRS